MRERRQKTPTRGLIRYLRQETWMKKRLGALHDRLLRRRKKEKIPTQQQQFPMKKLEEKFRKPIVSKKK